MASIDQQPAGRPDSGLSFIPVAWLVIVMGLSAYGLISNWRLIGDFSLPDNVLFLIYGGLAGGVITILWGLYLLGLAFNRSARFPRHYTIWQVAIIIWILVRQAYVLLVSDFVFSAEGLGFTVAEIAVGLLCIYLLRNGAGAETVYANLETERPPVFVSIFAALLGIILGGVIGAFGGFFAGSLIADLTHMSCFEGACGFFAAFIGLGGLIVGAIAGGIFAIWRVNRRGPPRAR
ncbi:DUF2569 family protein [Mesorhizobium sp. M2A.F.Ca.ET.037.01.1.1]|uniref:DUF2569 family protein n=2 Tax=Mesorhizobium TaxID=68287 RepID=UPI000F755890|nr:MULTISPECIES: DUF2569 family protein [unclassified Mesorhizobium]RUY11639.1 DUF2569 family protein [Mesorhizobium sp. M2A.F.Ca.ET.040.01.1.1]RVC69248.1 DUF2569 family protein [Mesorhizobium sp. M00.F.Ca.ET.038.03.1.1]AZO02996.1 DUF2569 family protein [Mesorhizobium sp. M2A.F.Ca.ET.043.02.1.1]AZO36916.1 DUF2569 family protein [Mesorhizobium sp. M2A.F.Ca.ET.046.03.2.1]RUW42830.1 DUF2569 family protein [Mesorhizobium sp. M2A.F.Ca.ET.015.02.1.1]